MVENGTKALAFLPRENAYLTKPINSEQCLWDLRFIDDFWFTVVKPAQSGEIAQ